MTPPPRQKFWSEALAWQGSVTPLVLPRVFMFGVYTAIVCAIVIAVESLFKFKLEMQIDSFEIAGAAISLILVLRTNAGYDRWWEARKLWGGIVNQCRNLAIDAKTYGPQTKEWQESFIRMVAVFPYVCKANLRDEDPPAEVANLVGTETAAAISQARHRPSYVAMKLAEMLNAARQQGEVDDFAFLQMDTERAQLIDHLGGCERILKTPLARVYSIKIRRFLALFLLTLPLPLLHKVEAYWAIPIFTMIVAYPLLSLDEIGIELQNPFWEKNLSHLPLIAISETIEGNLLEILDQQQLPSASPMTTES